MNIYKWIGTEKYEGEFSIILAENQNQAKQLIENEIGIFIGNIIKIEKYPHIVQNYNLYSNGL